jgi:hypothetical protein
MASLWLENLCTVHALPSGKRAISGRLALEHEPMLSVVVVAVFGGMVSSGKRGGRWNGDACCVRLEWARAGLLNLKRSRFRDRQLAFRESRTRGAGGACPSNVVRT